MSESGTWADLSRPEWFPDGRGSVWVVGYRVMRSSADELDPPIILDLGRARAVFMFGDVRYFDTSQLRFDLVTDSEWRIVGESKEGQTGLRSLLLVMAPFEVGDAPGNESDVRRDVVSAVGLILAFCGRNAAYEKIFENVVSIHEPKASGFSQVIENPLSLKSPAVRARQKILQLVAASLSSADEAEASRLGLALRWIAQATYDSGPDAYIKYWVALETLAMPDTTNIRPINEALSRIYGISVSEAASRFMVGHLQDFRSRIIHHGQLPPVHGMLLDYLDAVFHDVMLDRLGIASEQRAGALSALPEFNLIEMLSP